MMRRGFTLVEVTVVLVIMALLAGILMPSLKRARELAKAAGGAEAVAEVSPEPTLDGMEDAAEDAADEHDIYDRVIALTENMPSQQLVILIQGGLFDSSAPAEVFLWSDGDFGAAQVHIGGKMVYKQNGGEIQTYLGMGDWEYLLGEIEQKVASDREERFRAEREMRFGPLREPGDGG